MLTTRLMAALGCMVINLNMTTCRSPGEGEKSPPPSDKSGQAKVELDGIDTSELTPREKAQWSAHVSELLAPCESTTGTVAECVMKKKECAACQPAAQFLLTQVRRGLTSGQVESAYQSRFSADAVVEVEVGDSAIKGAPGAPITIVEFADFECPACRAAGPTIDEVVKSEKDVRLVFKNFPLSMHENAESAARAATAAGKQGKFWEMHAALFSSQEPLVSAKIQSLAKELGLDVDQFDKDLRSEAVADQVSAERKQGERAKIQATPSLFINGRRFEYADDLKGELLEWVALERTLLSDKTSPADKKAK